jgi:hypothetical protein
MDLHTFHLRPVSAAASVALIMLAAQACAAEGAPADNASGNTASGIMSFPHVRVINAPVAGAGPAALGGKTAPVPAQAPGMTAFIDPATGQLVQPTAEQAAALQAAAAARQAAKTNGRARAMAVTQPTMLYGADGSVGMMLDENSASYAVARKDAKGRLQQACAPSAEAAMAQLEAADRAEKGAQK